MAVRVEKHALIVDVDDVFEAAHQSQTHDSEVVAAEMLEEGLKGVVPTVTSETVC